MSERPEKEDSTHPQEWVERVGESKPHPLDVWTDEAGDPEGEEGHEQPHSG